MIEPKITVNISPHNIDQFYVVLRIDGEMVNSGFFKTAEAINEWVPKAKERALQQFQIAQQLMQQHNV